MRRGLPSLSRSTLAWSVSRFHSGSAWTSPPSCRRMARSFDLRGGSAVGAGAGSAGGTVGALANRGPWRFNVLTRVMQEDARANCCLNARSLLSLMAGSDLLDSRRVPCAVCGGRDPRARSNVGFATWLDLVPARGSRRMGTTTVPMLRVGMLRSKGEWAPDHMRVIQCKRVL